REGCKIYAEDWKEVHLTVIQEKGREVYFEVLDARDSQLDPKDLDPLAWRVTQEMVQVLNLKGKEVQTLDDKLPEEAILQDLSLIHLTIPKKQIEEFLGWMGTISRKEAEEFLKEKPVGTYLLREGDSVT